MRTLAGQWLARLNSGRARAATVCGLLAYAERMAISKELLEQLLKLDEHALSEIVTLLASDKARRSAAIAQLNDARPSPLDEMDPEERAELEADLEQSMAELDAGPGIPAEDVFARLRARQAERRAASSAPRVAAR